MKFLQKVFFQVLISLPISIFIGVVVAFFLWSLDWVTHFRFQHPFLLYLLPLGGWIIHIIYRGIGKSSEKGNNLVLEEIHELNQGVPWIMSPLILFTTLITHFFGGSAGREGTAVQIGASIASTLGKAIKLHPENLRTLLICGMAAGFGAVFGTPLAGSLFAIEVLIIGKLDFKAFIPSLCSSLIANFVVLKLGILHKTYSIAAHLPGIQHHFPYFPENLSLALKIIAISLAFGLSSRLFSWLIHLIKFQSLKFIKPLWFIPILGGILLISLSFLIHGTDYLGLGVNPEFYYSKTIASSFMDSKLSSMAWFWKTIFTSITLGSGFKGGEVTPLFYIGSCLGNTLAVFLNGPISLFAGLGFIGVFSGATKTPLASTLLGIELFGPQYSLYFLVVCTLASYFSGKTGIYSSQKRITDFR